MLVLVRLFNKEDDANRACPRSRYAGADNGIHRRYRFILFRLIALVRPLDFFTRALFYKKSQRNHSEYTRISPFLLLPLLGCNMFTY
ncbi:hypothetical protein HanXRQr2_Chr02g0054961 [Helianthus annuus]|uniref:Uncharacterized protein n=1 Tax=Helianthus annuus TaxID=4232 RepID=A0A251VE43_HELAN|nr:hypothetical protein HanXRQr2_Chr02g0054961 [Helianthus annuus]KAJ0577333.1 hypothetical protein HanIR_Chr05g0234781 [Helianthus annuus]KAJ0923032.1 hypothetical protein HanPSC8_Chr05g0210881 [Helianthus annuus]